MKKYALDIIFISCLLFFSCKEKKEPTNEEVPVNLYNITSQPVLYYEEYPATVIALNQVNLLPQVSGAITGIFFTEGSTVKKGQKLYEIDTRLYKASYDASQANLKVAQGTLAQAKQDADRYEYLKKNNAVATQLYDHAIISLENAKNQVKASLEAVNTAQTNLRYALITAPFNGTIGFSQVKIGNVVSPGSTILNTISTENPMAVDFLINEKQLLQFENAQRSKQQQSLDSLFTILLPDNSLYPHPGKFSVIDRAVDSQTGSIRVRLLFSNPEKILKTGMSCVVRVRNQDTSPQLLLSSKAIIEQMGEFFVYTAHDSIISNSKTKSNDEIKLVAIQKKVHLGQTIGPNVIIKSGLSAGDRVVIDGIQALNNGALITTANKEGPSRGKK